MYCMLKIDVCEQKKNETIQKNKNEMNTEEEWRTPQAIREKNTNRYKMQIWVIERSMFHIKNASEEINVY